MGWFDKPKAKKVVKKKIAKAKAKGAFKDAVVGEMANAWRTRRRCHRRPCGRQKSREEGDNLGGT